MKGEKLIDDKEGTRKEKLNDPFSIIIKVLNAIGCD
jgi:hypothetical protein